MLAVADMRLTKEVQTTLENAGHTVLRLPPHPTLPPPVASHPDMLLFFAPNAIYCTASYLRIAQRELYRIEKQTQKELRTIESDYGASYPNDVLLNALPIGDTLFVHKKNVARELIEQYPHTCHVNQGYTKCSAVPIGDHALITGDVGIAAAAERLSFRCLLISDLAVKLPGYDHGFIGGCTGFSPYIQSDTLFFSGDLSVLPQAKEIRAFCRENGVVPMEVTGHPLVDFGTIFFI